MKVCIVTEPIANNYGGILQNYALQTILKQIGYQPYTFDLGKFSWMDWIIHVAAITRHRILGRNYNYEHSPYYRKKIEKPLRVFVKNHIQLIRPRQRKLNYECVKKYDFKVFIVGSDQVWRPKYNHDLPDKYLAFMEGHAVRKISYAASFGTDVWEYSPEETIICSKLAKQFDAISVRELSGVNLCSKHFGIHAFHVLDPTFLLNVEDYKKLCEQIPRHDKFVFAYILDTDYQKNNEIKQFSDIRGLPCLIMSAGKEVMPSDSIGLWLSYFRDAEYIITDSFHGTVFSILFNKEFFVYRNEKRGNNRFESLLDSFGLQNRYFQKIDEQKSFINWEFINGKLSFLQKISMDWLKENINNSK